MRYSILVLGILLSQEAGSVPFAQQKETSEGEWIVIAAGTASEEKSVRVLLRELWDRPTYFHNRMIITQGTLSSLEAGSDEERGKSFELRDGRVAVPLLVENQARGKEAEEVLTSLDGAAVEVLGRFVNVAPTGGREEILSDIDSIVVASLRRLPPDEASRFGVPVGEADTSASANPPRVISSHPSPGERGVPLSTQIILRFSEDMDEASFEGNVRLRYSDESESSEDTFANLSLSYNPDTLSLVVDPGQQLERRREVHLMLLKGIRSKAGALMLRNTPPTTGKAGLRSRRSAPVLTGGEDVMVVLIFYTL